MGIMMVVLAGTFSAMTNGDEGRADRRGSSPTMNSPPAGVDGPRWSATSSRSARACRSAAHRHPERRRARRRSPARARRRGRACPGVPPTFPSTPTLSAVTVGPDLGAAGQRQLHRRHHHARRRRHVRQRAAHARLPPTASRASPWPLPAHLRRHRHRRRRRRQHPRRRPAHAAAQRRQHADRRGDRRWTAQPDDQLRRRATRSGSTSSTSRRRHGRGTINQLIAGAGEPTAVGNLASPSPRHAVARPPRRRASG